MTRLGEAREQRRTMIIAKDARMGNEDDGIRARPLRGARSAAAALTMAVATLGGSLAASGCIVDDDPWPPSCESEDASAATPNSDCGIFVSARLGDDSAFETSKGPMRTLRKAVEIARTLRYRRRIYACAETFPEAVDLEDGIDLWGGFDCEHGWSHGDHGLRTRIDEVRVSSVGDGWGTTTIADVEIVAQGLNGSNANGKPFTDPLPPYKQDYPPIFPPASVALRIESEGPVRVLRSHLTAGNGSDSGDSSIAMQIVKGAVEVVESHLVAGDGVDGISWQDWDSPGNDGRSGESGFGACLVDTISGGRASESTCYGPSFSAAGDIMTEVVTGGRGGDGRADRGGDGGHGQPGSPGDIEHGREGKGQSDLASCTDGRDGLPGEDGANGSGAKAPGFIMLSGIFLGKGQNGSYGLSGQGSGGGGGSRGGALFCGTRPKGGASGGAGGAGGCGGWAGPGGGAGGLSAGIVANGPGLRVRSTTIRTGRAGHGGNGGNGRLGGDGGLGGVGGAGEGGSAPGCNGGRGGKGGNGGHGGGGLGGHSVGIVYANDMGFNREDIDAEFTLGTPGKGGLGAGPTLPGTTGDDGIRAEVLSIARWTD